MSKNLLLTVVAIIALTVFLVQPRTPYSETQAAPEPIIPIGMVFGVHQLQLRFKVTPHEFEEFVRTQLIPKWRATSPSDIDLMILRGERGANKGHYIMVWVLKDLDARDKYWPNEEVLLTQALKGFATEDILDLIYKRSKMVRRTRFTDYVAIQ